MSTPDGQSAKLPPKKIQMDRFAELRVTWRDDTHSAYPIAFLRKSCPCASCREVRDATSDPFHIIEGDPVPEDLHVLKLEPVGHYALSFQFSDNHRTGIYSYEFLLEIAPEFIKG